MKAGLGENRLSVHPGLMQASAAAEKELSLSGAILYRRHITLDDLISHIRFQMAKSRPELARSPGQGGWRWITSQACVAEAGKLELTIRPELARSFHASFSEFFRVIDLLPSLPKDIWPAGLKGRWLKAVYENLHEKLRAGGLFSDGDVMRDFISGNPVSYDLPILEPFDLLELSGFLKIYPLQLQTLLHISHIKPVSFQFDYDPSKEQSNFHPALELIRAIESEARDLNVEIEFASRPYSVFSSASSDAFERVQLIECESREQETDWCSQQVRTLLDAGVKPNSIAIITTDIEAYRPYLRRQIREHSMPYAYRRSAGILSAPALRWLGWLPEALDDSVRVDVAVALADNLSSVLPALWPLNLDESTRCIKILREAGIFELNERRWLSAFSQGDEHELLLKLADALDALRNKFKKSRTLAEHIDLLSEIMADIDFCPPDNSDDRRHFSLDWHALQIAIKVLEEWRPVAESENMLIPGNVFLRELSEELDRNIRLRSSPEPDVVAILSPDEAAGLELEHLFWLGLVEGAYPPSFNSGILSDVEAGRMNRKAASKIWPDSSNAWQLAHELFSSLVETAQQVALSYFRHTEDGEEKQASPFYLELRELKQAAVDGSAVRIIDESDIQASQTRLISLAAKSGAIAHLSTSCGKEKVERISEKLQVEQERRDFFVFGAGDENSKPGEYSGLVPDFRLETPPLLNAGWFEAYAQCPFMFFIERVLGTKELPVEIYEIEAREVGTVLHDIMKNLAVTNKGVWNKAFGEEDAKQLAQQLEAEFRRLAPVSDDARIALAVLRSHEWTERLRDYMQRAALSEDGRTIMSEASFGAGRHTEKGLASQLEFTGPGGTCFRLNGRIDRVDWDGEVLRAVDYKTGAASSSYSNMLKSDSWGTEHFQMPIYLLALERSVNAGNLAFNPQGYTARVVALKDPQKNDREIRQPLKPDDPLFGDDEFTGMLEIIIIRAASGDFRIEPASCRACSYPAVCRVVKQAGKNE